MSHPNASVPNGCTSPSPCGRIFDSVIKQCCESALVNSPGNTATTRKKTRITAAAMVSGRRRSERQASATSVCDVASTAVATASVEASVIPDPGVERGVGDVDDEHHHDGDDGQDRDDAE